jgi:hypothetical protein
MFNTSYESQHTNISVAMFNTVTHNTTQHNTNKKSRPEGGRLFVGLLSIPDPAEFGFWLVASSVMKSWQVLGCNSGLSSRQRSMMRATAFSQYISWSSLSSAELILLCEPESHTVFSSHPGPEK